MFNPWRTWVTDVISCGYAFASGPANCNCGCMRDSCVLFYAEPTLSKPRWKETPRDSTISSGLPVYSGLRELQSSTNSGYTSAMVTRRFNCVSDCVGVTEYYSQILTANGWTQSPSADLPRGETLFRKGDLSISLSRSQSARGYDYAIDISWQSSLKGP